MEPFLCIFRLWIYQKNMLKIKFLETFQNNRMIQSDFFAMQAQKF
jgi:hypothetical protein